jgi:hypothetical protein
MADKDKQPQQADFDKAWENLKEGKIPAPTENDMGPLPTKKETTKPVKKMASGGKVSQLAKANGCAVRGKSKGRII